MRCCDRSVRPSVPFYDSIPFAGWRYAGVAVSNAFDWGQHVYGKLCLHQNVISGGGISFRRPKLGLLCGMRVLSTTLVQVFERTQYILVSIVSPGDTGAYSKGTFMYLSRLIACELLISSELSAL